jgi:surface carbohydrate biosynthesis protein
MEPSVALLVENAHREMESRILIGLRLREKGIGVVIGQQWGIWSRLRDIPSSVLMFKGLNAPQVRAMAVARDASHTVVAIDEESFGLSPEAAAAEISPGCCADRVYIASEHQTDAVGAALSSDTEVRAVGNPRADLLLTPALYQAESDAIREELGDFVLVNTNTSAVNPRMGTILDYVASLDSVGFDLVADGAYVRDHLAQDRANIRLVRRFIDAAPEGQKIVVRPHPGERAETWQKLYQGAPNVHVRAGGNLLPWLHAARMVVHTGCTTGLEAHLMGKPSVALQSGHPHDKQFVSNRINPVFDPVAAWEPDFGVPDIDLGIMADGQASRRIAEDLARMVEAPRRMTFGSSDPPNSMDEARQAKAGMSLEDFAALTGRVAAAFDLPSCEVKQVGEAIFAL